MKLRRSPVTVAVIATLVIAGTMFVQRQLARVQDQTDTARAKQSPGKDDVPVAPSRGPQMLNNPDGLEVERTMVPDSPFSATMIIETSERMPDGSVSTKTTTSLIYRDSKGRTRRDWLPDALSSATIEPTRSVIHDPVAGFTYNLDHRASSAQRTILVRRLAKNSTVREDETRQAAGRNHMLPVPPSIGTGNIFQPVAASNSPANKPESLGTRSLEGVLAEGTLLKVTLPAGMSASDQPVEITAERWYAPGLQTVILVKRTDSITGETTYRLTDINRNEPTAALFAPPPNYKLTDQTGREVSKGQNTP